MCSDVCSKQEEERSTYTRCLKRVHVMWRLCKENKGFTFVETVVVITIVALLTGAIGVSVDNVNQNTRIVNAATRALAELRHAQEMAITQRRTVNFNISVGSNYYSATYNDDGSYVPSPQGSGNLDVQLNQNEYDGVVITSSAFSSSQLSFNAVGRPLENGSVFTNEKAVMYLNSGVCITIWPQGFSDLETPSGGGASGCGSGC